jgi:predicted nucleotide-binding protein (sugar kinase/HSP70/actin superfamily)
MHGHIECLVEQGVDTVFYPCMPYNFNEKLGDNNYNCPVVAYYSELLGANMTSLKKVKFCNPYFGLHNEKGFVKKAQEYFGAEFAIPPREIRHAAEKAYAAYHAFRADIIETGRAYIDYARENGKQIIVVCGRPYHCDPEINHGIDELITSFDLVLITEDAVSDRMPKQSRKVLNQWTYHARMYNAARYVVTQPDMQLVQLESFGCGTDAIPTDEMRSILEEGGKLYTQLKIDDISNLGAVRIRIRSMIAAIEEKNEKAAG